MAFSLIRVEAKTIDLPWVSFLFIAMIAVVTYFQRSKLGDYLADQAALSGRTQFQWQLKKYLDSECQTYLDSTSCEVFHREVLPGYLADEKVLDIFLQSRLSASRLEKLRLFLKPWQNEEMILQRSESTSSLQSLGEVRKALLVWREQRKQYHESRGLLSLQAHTARSFLLAPFLHGSAAQVLFLVALFLCLAPFVEQRMGAIWFSIFLFASAWMGTGAELVFQKPHLQFGSVLAIQTVGAAFLVFFARHRVQINLKMPFFRHKLASSKPGLSMTGFSFFIIWGLVLQACVFSQEYAFPHVLAVPATLGGSFFALAWGIAVAIFFERLFPVPEGMVYHYEKKLSEKANQVQGTQKQFQVFRHWYHLNPSSVLAVQGILDLGRRLQEENDQDSLLRTFLTTRWSEIFHIQILNPEFVGRTPYAWLREEVLQVDPDLLISAISFFAERKQAECEWKLIVCLLWGQRQKGHPDLEKRLIQLSDQVMHSLEFVSELQLACEKNRDFDEFLKKMGFVLNTSPVSGSATGTNS